ncbi:MAG: prolyl oligopeptidase family serine peptidase [Streptosporangiales bacterium]|nr:prolyl oligopeptidase family serine peptidase [Streptosporangiales bacterium]
MSFPRQHARTRRFTLGAPRAFQIAPDGDRVTFLRSRAGDDPVNRLWTLDLATGEERVVADPVAFAATDEDLPPEERARRERAREQAGGVVGYSTDRAHRTAAFTLSGRLYIADLHSADSEAAASPAGSGRAAGRQTAGAPTAAESAVDEPTAGERAVDEPTAGERAVGEPVAGGVRELPAVTPVVMPVLDPTGSRVAYVNAGALHVIDVATGADTVLAEPDGDRVTWGLAEFIAAEEMDRMRGMWWSPDGERLLATRVDDAPVQRWHIADPADPGNVPQEVGYPAAGTANADVTLFLLDLDGTRTEVAWDTAALPYLAEVAWDEHAALLVVQSRDQALMRLLAVDLASGATATVREDTDPAWVEIVPGVPAHTDSGTLVWAADADGARRLIVGDTPVTPADLQLRTVLDVDGETVLFTASTEPTEIGLWTYEPGGLARIDAPGEIASGRRAGGTTLVSAQGTGFDGVRVQVLTDGGVAAEITSLAETPDLPTPRVTVERAGERELRTTVLLPSWHRPGDAPLPVLMDPYGGPHAQRVLAARAPFLTSQWFAEQGFAVIVADGRGSPGRGSAWERAVRGNLADPVLEDQVDALHAAAAAHPELDLGRVAMRGWSFGGYLAALAVLRRPDVFHAAVAGAPVTDWRLYDTHYTERYLGDPVDNGVEYEHSSLLVDAPKLERPLMLIHGLADDNVVAAHTLRLSSALLAAGRPHTVLPLSGVTHMTPQEVVAENLLLLQVDFLRDALGPAAPRSEA